MSLLLLFGDGGGGTVTPTTTVYPRIIYLTNGRLAIRIAGKLYKELQSK